MRRIYLIALGVCLTACQSLPTSSEWLERGNGYFKDGKTAQALRAYNRAEKLNPNRADIYESRGTAYFFNGQYSAAKQDFIKALTFNPYKADTYTALASALAALGEYEEALRFIDDSLTLNASKPETFFTRGGINFMLGNYEQAVYDYATVLQFRPSADVYNARGAAYLKLGKKEAAEQDFAAANSGKYPEKINEYRMID